MPELKDFNPNPDAPYYVPCIMAQTYEMLRYRGFRCSLSLLPNLLFKGLPAYCVAHDFKTARMDSSPASYLLGYPPDISFYFGLKYKTLEYRSLEEGLEAISHQISKGQPMILSGTTYFLPYSKDYQSPAYLRNYPNPIFGVADHWLTVAGITDQQVLVFDPIPNKYFGPISHYDFAGFWRGNRGIPELHAVPGINNLKCYGGIKVQTRKRIAFRNDKKLHFATLKTLAIEFLRGTTIVIGAQAYSFGQKAALQFKSDLIQAFAKESTEVVSAAFSQCFIDVRFPRYFFRDLLADAALLYNLPKDHLDCYSRIVRNWEIMSTYFVKIALSQPMDQKYIDKTLTLMDETILIEKEFHEELLKELDTFGPIKILPRRIKKRKGSG